ncbi:MAG: hypothetical protein CVU56_24725 [Deltaproteobacteria bacterium HGW-Deltaproteobacteria-14]|jgi:predicted secreted hydrolase|nr:MAG: hypothetical protein CVU56_24725 [Deltaproteobacteria bacterium HGW-Deltaproteobacteria-14]
MRSSLIAALAASAVGLLACAGDGPGATPPDVVSGALCQLPVDAAVTLPADDSRHSEPAEWYYWTGHLRAADGRWFGYQVTLLYVGSPGAGVVIAHRTLSDPATGRFHQTIDFAPEDATPDAGGIAQGLDAASRVTSFDGHDTIASAFDDATLTLSLDDAKGPVVRHGSGFQDYGDGVYTWYYARPRMRATGTLTLGGEVLAVTGTGWFDHQWGVLAPPGGIARWDWLGAQLDDDRELMVYRLPTPDGGLVTLAELTAADCTVTHFDPSEVSIETRVTWTKPGTACVYPVGWRVTVGDLVLDIDPVQNDQEVEASPVAYWEGAAVVSGGATGRAYVELVGYCAGD